MPPPGNPPSGIVPRHRQGALLSWVGGLEAARSPQIVCIQQLHALPGEWSEAAEWHTVGAEGTMYALEALEGREGKASRIVHQSMDILGQAQ